MGLWLRLPGFWVTGLGFSLVGAVLLSDGWLCRGQVGSSVKAPAGGGAAADFDAAWATFYNRSDEATARNAWQHLRPMRTAPGTTVGLDHRPWEHTPSTYVVCLDDRALKADVQRSMAANMRDSVTIDSDHSPFLTAPRELADIVNGVLARTSSELAERRA